MNVSHPGKLRPLINSWLDGREITDDPASEASHRSWRSGAETRIPELPLQPTLPDERPVMATDIGHRRESATVRLRTRQPAADPANPLIPDERDPGPRLGLIGPLGHPTKTKTKTKTSARCRQRTPSATSREATSTPPPALLSRAIS